jgi:hypothetical protein
MKHPHTRLLVLSLCWLFLAFSSEAQLHLGFYGGLTFSNIQGPVEKPVDAAGEEFSSITGFHIGLRGQYDLNDWLAVGGGFGYAQKGAQYTYQGPSFFRLQNRRTATFPFFEGSRQVEMQINTDHLDIPVFIQFSPFDQLQIYGGPYVSFTILARSTGAIRFTPDGAEQLEVNIDYNYFSDEFGLDPELATENIEISGEDYFYPESVGPYYELDEVENNLFEVVDYGLQGGLNFFITSGLYLNGEIMYGLNDMTNERVDFSIVTRDAGGEDFIYRDDFDRFISYKLSIGFAF